jgi:hypothetical protein
MFDIQLIVRRTLVYTVVTIVVGALYTTVAVVPVVIFHMGKSSDPLVAAATLVAAAAFRPVRRRAQRIIDRRFNRARYDASHTIEAFAARLRDEIDIDTLGAELREVVAHTMQPQHVSLWVRGATR